MRLPNGWTNTRLSKLSKTRISNGAFNDPKKVGSGYRLINVVNLYTPRRIEVNTLNFLELTEKEFKNFQAENGDLFFTRSSLKLEGIAHCNIFEGVESNVVYECHIMRVRPISTRVIPKYLLEYCQSHAARKHFMSCAKTGTMTTIDQEGIGSLNVLLPSLPEQQKIAKIFSTWDQAIEKLETLIIAKQKRKKALMQQLLTGKKRFAGFKGEWKSFLIEELEELGLIELGRGNVISKKDIETISGNFPIYSSSVKNDGLFGHYGKYMFDEELITWSVDGGGNFFYRHKHKFSITNVSGYMRVDTKKINYKFLASQLELLHAKLSFDYQSKAHPSVIRKLYLLSIPSLEEQQKIAYVLSSVDKEIVTHKKQLAVFKKQKKGLTQQLLTGKKRIQVEDQVEEIA